MKKKLKLDALNVQSFITNVESENVKGAGTQANCTTWYSATQCLKTKECTLDPSECIVIAITNVCVTYQCTGTGPTV